MRMGTPKQLMSALLRHSVVLAGHQLGHDNVVGAIEEVTAIYGHRGAFAARHHPDKRRVRGDARDFQQQDAPFPSQSRGNSALSQFEIRLPCVALDASVPFITLRPMRRVIWFACALGLFCGGLYATYFLLFQTAFPMGFSLFSAFFAVVGGYWLWVDFIAPRYTSEE
jgi:hypothetical protein